MSLATDRASDPVFERENGFVRRILSWACWLIMAPLLVAIVVFALNNKSLVALDLWPFGLVVELPIYLALFAALGLGVLIGAFVAWLGQGRVRSNLRGQAYAAEVARRELQAEREKSEGVLTASKALPPLQRVN